jgi:hypothetical protein
MLNCINWFGDEDARYLSSYRTGEIWRIPVSAGIQSALVREPDGVLQRVAVHEGRAVLAGQHAGFYELELPSNGGASSGAAQTISFAANLLDASESAIAPRDQLSVDGSPAGGVTGFRFGVRRQIWIYLLVAAILLTTLEWATYHRRVTV